MKITKKIVAILMLLILMLSSISNIIYAAEISEADQNELCQGLMDLCASG